MDVNELIDNLRMPSWHDLEDPDATLLADAADALSTLQTENEKLRAELDSVKCGRDAVVRFLKMCKPCVAFAHDSLPTTHPLPEICRGGPVEIQMCHEANEKLRAELKSKVDLVFQQTKELDRRNLLLREQEAELDQVKKCIEIVEFQRDAAIKQLHGHCPSCTHYTPNHNEGPCQSCKYEHCRRPNMVAKDNWEWRGP